MPRERLPNIHIRPPAGASSFLADIAEIARDQGSTVKSRRPPLKPGEILEIEPSNSLGNRNLVAQLIRHNDNESIARLEIRTTDWNQNPPTYDEYVDVARAIMQPLLKVYNKNAGSRCRLLIQARAQLEPRLPPRASESLQGFIDINDGRAVSSSDWSLFYDFIWVCRRTRVSLGQSDIREILCTRGISEEVSRELAEVYDHGLKLLWRRR